MGATSPDFIGRRGIEPGLVAMIIASAALHIGGVALLLTLPGKFLSAPTGPVSYTVDLIAPNTIGGTNLVKGGGAKAPPAAPKPASAEPKAAPIAEPITRPKISMTSTTGLDHFIVGSTNVAIMAIAMPTAPSKLPRTAVRGWLIYLKPTMNSAEAKM